MNDTAPIVIRQARWKLVLMGVGSLGFCALGWLMIVSARQDHPCDPWPQMLMGGFCMAFCIACALVAVACLFRPVTLSLGPQGLSVRTLFKRYERAWADVSDFRIGSIRMTRMVVFDDRRLAGSRMSDMNRSLVGADASLPTGLTVAPGKLLELVIAAKARWG